MLMLLNKCFQLQCRQELPAGEGFSLNEKDRSVDLS